MRPQPAASWQAALASVSWLKEAAAAVAREKGRCHQQRQEPQWPAAVAGRGHRAQTPQLGSSRRPSGSMQPLQRVQRSARQAQEKISRVLPQPLRPCK